MGVHVTLVWVAVALWAAAAGEVRRGGWLQRLVQHYKSHFFEDLGQLAPVDIQASIEVAPVGYVDSAAWDSASVSRLLALLRASAAARPVRRALRRALFPAGGSRRFMSRQKSYKLFPSLAQMHSSNMYYDADTDEDYAEEEGAGAEAGGTVPDRAVVVLRNPVEARLPSARISISLLKEILEARAIAARKMPPTKTTPGLIWTTKEKSVTPAPEHTESLYTTTLEPGETDSPTTPITDSTTPANDTHNTTGETDGEKEGTTDTTEGTTLETKEITTGMEAATTAEPNGGTTAEPNAGTTVETPATTLAAPVL